MRLFKNEKTKPLQLFTVSQLKTSNSQDWLERSLAAVGLRLLHTDGLIHGFHLAVKAEITHAVNILQN